ncbi:MAG: DUF4381 domain-containing protein [Gammaproteobacteria bacterium]|nr:DUF4381 domain-containing protein [Gammaproteobacteria bacterium]
MNPEELLLRDIHLPEPLAWWPPAIGWWLLFALALLIGFATFAWLRRRARRQNSPATIAERDLERLRLAWVEHADAHRLLRDLSTWLRRAGMSLASRDAAASLTGERWILFLDELAGAEIFAQDAALLTAAPYRLGDEVGRDDGERLLSACARWLAAVVDRMERAR